MPAWLTLRPAPAPGERAERPPASKTRSRPARLWAAGPKFIQLSALGRLFPQTPAETASGTPLSQRFLVGGSLEKRIANQSGRSVATPTPWGGPLSGGGPRKTLNTHWADWAGRRQAGQDRSRACRRPRDAPFSFEMNSQTISVGVQSIGMIGRASNSCAVADAASPGSLRPPAARRRHRARWQARN